MAKRIALADRVRGNLVAAVVAASAGGVGVVGSAGAQLTPTFTYTIEWENAPLPGVAAKGGVYVMCEEIGKDIQWFTPPGTGQWGEAKAFASTIYSVVNVQNATTGTLSWTVPAEFSISQKPGDGDGNGGISSIHGGQFGPPLNTNPVVDNKVKVLTLEWMTTDFSTYRFVEWTTKATSGKVYLDVGLSAWVGQNVIKVDGSGGFWVVPAPGGLALMGLAGVAAMRRRRV